MDGGEQSGEEEVYPINEVEVEEVEMDEVVPKPRSMRSRTQTTKFKEGSSQRKEEQLKSDMKDSK